MSGISDSMDRRQFIKVVGAGAALAAFGSCGSKEGTSAKQGDVPADKMTYRTDPKTGNQVSLLGYGCMRYPRLPKSADLASENNLDQEAINRSIDYAIDHGVNYFDTSPLYCKGFSEIATGIALSRHPRNKYFIATKMSNRNQHSSREASLKMYKRSFENLRTDYIDYYLVHNVGSFEALKERYIDNGIMDFLMEERKAGRIRSLGWSFHGDGDFFDYMALKYDWDFVMIQLNYFDWDIVQEWRATVNARHQYELLTKNNIPIIIMEPLLGGRLAMPHYKARTAMAQANPNASAASWAFRFAGSFPNVFTVLSGMTFMEHLQDNIRTYSPLEPLSEHERKMLIEVAQVMLEHRNINCTTCQYCMPCPYGLDIPEIFSHYNRSLNEGNFPDNKQSEDYKRARKAFLVGLSRKVASMRQANRCTSCKECVPNCPQNIQIPQEMQRIDRFIESLKRDVV
ncbi:MAG: aldo/keto reductase [Fibromonadaceae bacterium]|jgi:predicted aldo/keto reductase-like oxidoreductase|nr:aldo/keto reductase [Fibromonadaceae bacterium]